MSGIIGGAGSKSGVIGTTELDYEEGTWTVTWFDAASGGTQESATTNATGYYVKIGKLVHCSFMQVELKASSAGGSSGVYYTLPFTTSSTNKTSGSVALHDVDYKDNAFVTPIVSSSVARGYFLESDSPDPNSTVIWDDIEATNTYIQHLTITFRVD